MAKILLTGAAGFIGSQVLKYMAQEHDITAIDNLSDFSNYYMKQRRLANLAEADVSFDENSKLKNGQYLFFKLDILDEVSLDKLFADSSFDMVIHLAAMTGIRQSVQQPDIYEKVNVRGFYNIIENCRKHNVKRLLFASSSSVYGDGKDAPFTEQSNTDMPLNLYAATKKMNELIAYSYASLYHIHCVGLRFFTVYGPWTRPDMATYTFIKSISEGTPIKLYNSGEMERDFTYVGDIAESIRRITTKMNGEKTPLSIPYHIFNIGEGKPVNLKEYVSVIESLLGKKAIIENHPLQKGEMLRTFADCTALFDYTGFRPQVSVAQGLADTVAWYKTYREKS